MNSIVAAKAGIPASTQRTKGNRMADVFAPNVNVIVIVDTSSNMIARDAMANVSPVRPPPEELRGPLQGRYPGQAALIAF